MVQQESLAKRFKIVGPSVVWKDGKNVGKISGYLNKDGYREINVKLGEKKVSLFAHQISFILKHGYLPDLIDHIDQDTTNDDPDNLRDADKRINSINRGIPENNTSGIKGVSWHRGKWTAYIKDKQKKYHLGRFENIEDARIARSNAERELWNDV